MRIFLVALLLQVSACTTVTLYRCESSSLNDCETKKQWSAYKSAIHPAVCERQMQALEAKNKSFYYACRDPKIMIGIE